MLASAIEHVLRL